ncbi:MAG: holo-ACP synthase [Candidatus Bipolaricaulota bacterium]|nr:holo-ACP synthase [Candidatus Bipolaricaulota bacterium]MBS3791207.1 holo-ACP synthase [Candidatus Bipolaricaulota bacterium]
MAVRGIGIDIVKVPRLKQLVDRWDRKFLDRVFTDTELDYCFSARRKHEHLAGRFAAKEAVIKALGEKIPWKSINVESERNGRPFVLVERDEGKDNLNENLHISITHLEDYALAIAVLET